MKKLVQLPNQMKKSDRKRKLTGSTEFQSNKKRKLNESNNGEKKVTTENESRVKQQSSKTDKTKAVKKSKHKKGFFTFCPQKKTRHIATSY